MLLGLVLVTVFLASLKPLTNEDAYWHLAAGREIWTTGHLVRSETFSFSAPGTPRVDEEWLFHALGYPAWKALGDSGLPYLVAALATLGWALTYRCVRLAGGNAAAFALYTAALLPALETRIVFRPDIISFSFMAILAEGLLRWRPRGLGEDRFWLFTGLLFLCWCQFHGTWSFGLVLLGATAAGKALDLWREKRLDRQILGSMAVACLTPVVAMFVNPYGWRIPWFPLMHVLSFGEKDLPLVTEWNPLPWAWVTAPFIAVILATVLAQLLPWRRRAEGILWCGSQAALAFHWIRTIGLMVITLAPYACRELAALLQKHRWQEAGWFVALLATLATALPHTGKTWSEEEAAASYPFQEVRFLLDRGVGGRVFHEYHVGGYIEWKAPHQLLILYDGRFFPFRKVHKDLDAAWGDLDAFRTFLDRYQVDIAIMPYPNYRLKGASADAGAPPRGPSVRMYPQETWALVNFGDYGMVFLRRGPRFAPVIERDEFRALRPDDLAFLAWGVRNGSIEAAPLFSDLGRRLRQPASLELCKRLQAVLTDLAPASPAGQPGRKGASR